MKEPLGSLFLLGWEEVMLFVVVCFFYVYTVDRHVCSMCHFKVVVVFCMLHGFTMTFPLVNQCAF